VARASALPGVTVATTSDVLGREFDHVFVLWDAATAGPPALAMTRSRGDLVLSAAPSGPSDAALLSPPPALERARLAVAGDWEPVKEELFGPAAALHALLSERREELLESVARVGARLGELRFDTDLDIAHTVVRLLELIKLAALLERRAEEPIGEALADINARLAAAATPLEREVLASSPLDELLSAEEGAVRGASRPADEPSLAAFLRRRGDGLVLSASDIETYRACRCATSSPACCACRASRRSTNASGSSSTRSSSATTSRPPATTGGRRSSTCSTRPGAAVASATRRRSGSCA